jgi:hypothetical protein
VPTGPLSMCAPWPEGEPSKQHQNRNRFCGAHRLLTQFPDPPGLCEISCTLCPPCLRVFIGSEILSAGWPVFIRAAGSAGRVRAYERQNKTHPPPSEAATGDDRLHAGQYVLCHVLKKMHTRELFLFARRRNPLVGAGSGGRVRTLGTTCPLPPGSMASSERL